MSNANSTVPADDSIGPDDPTVEMHALDLPLCVRVSHALAADTLELEPTVELPSLLRRQAE